MDISEIQSILGKPATKLTASSLNPIDQRNRSWLGKVFLYKENETIPKDSSGELMNPLAQVYIPDLPFVSPLLDGIEVLTIFVSKRLPYRFEDMGSHWLIREYESVSDLVRKDLSSPESVINPLPLKAEFIDRDYPLWNNGNVAPEITREILKLQKEGKIKSYHDVLKHCHSHKIGGYPSFCQSGVRFGDDFEFVFQISSDSEINFNVVDDGSLMFAKNSSTNQWVIYYDFY